MGKDEETPKEVKDIIAPCEKVLYVAKQKGSKLMPDITKRIFPAMVILTDRRVIQIHPKGLIGGALGMRDYSDYPYEGMSNIQLDRGAFRATLNITLKSMPQGEKNRRAPQHPRISDIDKNEAADIFGIVREILMKQETRQATAPVTVFAAPPYETESPIQQLEKLSKLRQGDIITEEEFLEKKKELLRKI